MKNFKIKTDIYFGAGSLDRLKEIGNKKVFIITDPFMVKSGTINKITDRLNGAQVTIFSDIVPDPPIELVVKGIEELKKVMPEVIIALGGGSAIDADLIALVYDCTNEESYIPPGFASMFMKEVIGIITKVDLAESDLDIKRAEEVLEQAGAVKIFKVNTLLGVGIKELVEYIWD